MNKGVMAYNETYTSADISAIVIDILAGLGVALVGFAGIMGLILLYGWFKKRVKF